MRWMASLVLLTFALGLPVALWAQGGAARTAESRQPREYRKKMRRAKKHGPKKYKAPKHKKKLKKSAAPRYGVRPRR